LFGVEGFAHELKGINNFIKTKLNRLVYRDAMVRALDERVGSRRRLLNRREYSLLDFLLRETEPIDPFSEKPSRTINLSDFRGSPYVQGAYDDVTSRTFVRELVRLSNMGFITFKRNEAAKDWLVEIDFRAVGKY
jgi:DNA-binding MarR family transcriptional regulator